MTGIDIRKFREEYQLTQVQISAITGVTVRAVQSWEQNQRSVPQSATLLLEAYRIEQERKNILNEPIVKYEPKSLNKKNEDFPLIDIDAMAGHANGDSQTMAYDVASNYRIPELEGKGVKYLIRVSGSSMYPKYSNGDLLACKPLSDKSFFQWGKPYVLDTEQGAIVKRLFPCKEDDDCLECHSDNITHYPPFKIPKESIRSIAIVVGVIRLE